MESDDFNRLTGITQAITEIYPETATFIGEVAVWHHCLYDGQKDFDVVPWEGELVIGTYEFGELRELENVNRHTRLGKYHFEKNGVSFFVHPQHQTNLAVPVEEIISESEIFHRSRVANLGHILKLKAVAAHGRKDYEKRNRDQDDIVRTLLCLRDKEIPDNIGRLDHVDCGVVQKSIEGEATLRICKGDVHNAKTLRETVQDVWDRIITNNDQIGQG